MPGRSDLPPVTITVTTYAADDAQGQSRARAIREVWRSWVEHLHYDGSLRVHVGDDGSELPGFDEAWWHNRNRSNNLPIGPLTYSRQHQGGVGASLNAGWRQAIQDGALSLYVVDDWELTGPLDLTPWAELIVNHGLGGVRLGPPHPGLTGTVLHWENRWYLLPARHNFVFGQRPALFDPAAMVAAYGWHPEGVNALECERMYNQAYLHHHGPDIVLALLHPWRHSVGSASLSAVTPGLRADKQRLELPWAADGPGVYADKGVTNL